MSNKKETKTNLRNTESEKERLFKLTGLSLQLVQTTLDGITKAGLENEQFVINWLDALNEISVTY